MSEPWTKDFEVVHPIGRLLIRVFGVDRIIRFNDWLERTANPPRCSWRSPGAGSQCVRKAGHRGCCDTQYTHTNSRAGKTFTTQRSWYGVNYD